MSRLIACARCGLRLRRVRTRTVLEKLAKHLFDLERLRCPECNAERLRKRARRTEDSPVRARIVLLMLTCALIAFLVSSGKLATVARQLGWLEPVLFGSN